MCIVSVSIGEFMSTIKAYHRVMDLKEQHRDPATLAVMVKALVHGTVQNSEIIRPKLKELFARISSKDGRDPRIWMIYAELLSNDADQSEAMHQRVLQCLSRAHHGMCPTGWEHDNSQCKRAIMSALALVDKSIEYNISYTSARLAVKSIKAVLANLRSNQLEEISQDIRDLLVKVDEAEVAISDKM